MMMNRCRFVLALVVLATLTGEVTARAENAPDGGAAQPAPREKLDGPKLDALLAEITLARREVKTLRASFTQERRITLLATSVKSRGELTFAAPDRLRWDLAAPDDVAYFVGPEGLAFKSKSSSASMPAGGANVGRALTDLRALIGGDLGALRARYLLEASRGPNDVEIAGVAKDAGLKTTSVRAFTLVLDRKLILPMGARLLEGKNDSIDITFSNVVLNGPVDPARLRP